MHHTRFQWLPICHWQLCRVQEASPPGLLATLTVRHLMEYGVLPLTSEELLAAVAPDPTCSHAARLLDAGLFPHSHLNRPDVNVLQDTSLPPRIGVACGTWRAIPLHACTMVRPFTLFVSACSGTMSVPWSSACSRMLSSTSDMQQKLDASGCVRHNACHALNWGLWHR